jgi:uncharacterized repeat protein (TIGR03837 family)
MDLGHTALLWTIRGNTTLAAMLWDIFCKVIDNHGDIGVCWRLAAQLAARGERVRLWVDDASALQWMAPAAHQLVDILPWSDQTQAAPADVVVEAFGCELGAAYQAALAASTGRRGAQPVWLNLEYLTAEAFGERSHGLPSPVLSGPAAGLTKYFFYPGFTAATGGLLRESDLAQRQAAFDPAAWLRGHGVVQQGGARIASLFCYEPAGLPQLLAQLAAAPQPTCLLVTAGRATAAVQQALRQAPLPGSARLSVCYLPLLTQHDFDHLLWSCDVNLVRGEDSLVRALWAGRPFVWQLYPQDDGAHHAKLEAFLDWLQAPPSWRAFHRFWNGASGSVTGLTDHEWSAGAVAARDRLLAQSDLLTKLLAFVATKAGAPLSA